MAQTSIQKIDRTAKVAKAFRQLAAWVVEECQLDTAKLIDDSTNGTEHE